MKRIGIVFSKRDNKATGINNAYLTYFEQFGEIVYINPISDTIIEDLDLLVLPGGRDVNPARYNAKPHRQTGGPNLDMEYFDVNVFPRYLELELPVVGICRGAQTLNVMFDGTLSQDIPQNYSPNRIELTDTLKLTDVGQQMFRDLDIKADGYQVNSIHHQGWYPQEVPENFQIIATNKDLLNVEAMYDPELRIWAVQYHPEEIFDELTTKVIKNYLLND